MKNKIDIEVARASPGAIEAVEKLGGTIKAVYHSRRDLRAIIHPELFAILPKEPLLPTEWSDLRKSSGLVTDFCRNLFGSSSSWILGT